ncbi:DNA alkylation repair protein [Alteribacter aurantiacus]|uniref:DNA alkylation repair protein n=1 Tax=Alteribacter aurantiacus TaxID=254410 RepID=UPI0003FD6661|nr:DNA alkylation repair protein [Alteribacter aurantiacus]
MTNEVEQLIRLFESHRNEEQAGPMSAYMKHHFPFLGIKSPLRKELTRTFLNETLLHKESELPISALIDMWGLPEREYHYTVIEIVARMKTRYKEEDLAFFEMLITTQSWWDSVDGIAPNVIGHYFDRFPHEREVADRWAVHENMWLRRTAILHQLKKKKDTDEDRLFHYCRINREDNEFFIRKAIGWALREYSKTAPEAVEHFIEKESLSPLSKREGRKHLDRVKKGV